METALFSQSYGGDNRRIPLVPAQRPNHDLFTGTRVERGGGGRSFVVGHSPISQDGKGRGGSYMNLRKHSTALVLPDADAPSFCPTTESDKVIQVDKLSKKYLVGHETAHHDSLREAIVRHAVNFSRKAMDIVRGRQIV